MAEKVVAQVVALAVVTVQEMVLAMAAAKALVPVADPVVEAAVAMAMAPVMVLVVAKLWDRSSCLLLLRLIRNRQEERIFLVPLWWVSPSAPMAACPALG